MAYLSFQSNYDRFPETQITGYEREAWAGYTTIAEQILLSNPRIIAVDCYPGTDDQELLPNLKKILNPDHIFLSSDFFYPYEKTSHLIQSVLTEDRVRGHMYYGDLMSFVDKKKLIAMQQDIDSCKGRILVYGWGAALLERYDLLLLADMARWEIQLRYRRGMSNQLIQNAEEENLKKFKCGYFLEWRVADKHKRYLLERMDYYLDTNTANQPHMVTRDAFHAGLQMLTKRPFRLVPYFDPGVWGGQWMKEVCNLDPAEKNYAWCFDGVPEENSLYLRYGDIRLETPAMNLTLAYPKAFLGEKTFSRFGAEFPIRFDFLDTMDGQNLSLQVHPDMEYIHTHFGMAYTQDESYYILDTQSEQACVYLGVQKDVNPEQMIADLQKAQLEGEAFDTEKYINCFPAHPHDHFLIPAGTIHCSGKGCMVLEISATPYIFTFKLWDWDRVDLNGKPRPIHIEEGKEVIRYDRDTEWVKENLINQFKPIYGGNDYQVYQTGLHELEFIETQVYVSTGKITLEQDGEFSILNLVEGESALISSTENLFNPYVVHYAETFILPADCGSVTISPGKNGKHIRVLRAKVRH